MKRHRWWAACTGSAATWACVPLVFAMTPQTRIDYNGAIERAAIVFRDAQAKCAPLAGHARDMCAVQAKATELRARAAADENYNATDRSRTESQIADAQADSMIAKVACDILAAPERDACVGEAQAAQVKRVADAQAEQAAIDARESTRSAQYESALARCGALSGSDRSSCVTSARSTYAK